MTLNGSHNGNKIHVECHAAFSPGNVGPEIKVPFAVRWLLSVVYVICLSTCCLHFRAHFALLQLSLMLQLNSAKSVWHLLFMLTHSHSHSHTVTQSHCHTARLEDSPGQGQDSPPNEWEAWTAWRWVSVVAFTAILYEKGDFDEMCTYVMGAPPSLPISYHRPTASSPRWLFIFGTFTALHYIYQTGKYIYTISTYISRGCWLFSLPDTFKLTGV